MGELFQANCPLCTVPLVWIQTHGRVHIFNCSQHGRMILDADGRLVQQLTSDPGAQYRFLATLCEEEAKETTDGPKRQEMLEWARKIRELADSPPKIKWVPPPNRLRTPK
jgi:hypothetical protein